MGTSKQPKNHLRLGRNPVIQQVSASFVIAFLHLTRDGVEVIEPHLLIKLVDPRPLFGSKFERLDRFDPCIPIRKTVWVVAPLGFINADDAARGRRLDQHLRAVWPLQAARPARAGPTSRSP